MKRIYLIDCPGIVPPNKNDSEQDILLKGVVRVENVEHPAQYIEAVLKRAQTKHIERTYDIKYAEYDNDPIEFLSVIARKSGRLLRGGEADVDGVAKMVLNDFLRGKVPWFTPPQGAADGSALNDEQVTVVEGRDGRLGEMPGKRKAETVNKSQDSEESEGGEGGVSVDETEVDNAFETFSDEETSEEDAEEDV